MTHVVGCRICHEASDRVLMTKSDARSFGNSTLRPERLGCAEIDPNPTTLIQEGFPWRINGPVTYMNARLGIEANAHQIQRRLHIGVHTM